jgi:hypothetical protein
MKSVSKFSTASMTAYSISARLSVIPIMGVSSGLGTNACAGDGIFECGAEPVQDECFLLG